MKSGNSSPVTFGDVISSPPFFADPVLSLTPFVSNTLLQIARVPHKFALCHTASGSAQHLRAFKGHEQLGPIVSASGIDLSSTTASSERCLFELLERVWSSKVNIAALPKASFAELKEPKLDPRSLVLPTDDEYQAAPQYVRYTENLPLHWTGARRLTQEGIFDKVLVPAVFVFSGFGFRCPEERIAPMLSTGLATGRRYDEALLRGLCEVVERDAFALAWLCNMPPPRIRAEQASLSDAARTAIEELAADKYDVGMFDLTLDVSIPVAMTVISSREKGESGFSAIGFGCSHSPLEALSKSVTEALLIMTNYCEFPGGTDVVRKPMPNTLPFAERELRRATLANFLSSKETSARFDAPAKKLDPVPETLAACLAELERNGLEAYFCDLTPPESQPGQFCLVRVLIPGMQPHLYETDCWRLAGERVQKFGSARRGEINKVLNPIAWEALP